MMWLLLFGLTALVALLPLWPAIHEWLHPHDVVPLAIDTADALDPPFMARAFTAHLAAAAARGQTQLNGVDIAPAPTGTPALDDWPLSAHELREQASARIWRSGGDAVLPDGIAFLAEVAAPGSLHTAAGGVYRALLAGRRLRLAPQVTLRRWAHGSQVDVAAGCRLRGRVSADTVIALAAGCDFGLLHAPVVRFEPLGATAMPLPASFPVLSDAWPASVHWSAAARRATSDAPLELAAGGCWAGDIVCHDDIVLGAGCLASGSLKSRADITAGSACCVGGSIVAEGRIALGAHCRVGGSVVSETAVVLGAGCVVGAVGRPATVAAPQIDVGPGVVVHGTLWAGETGRSAPVRQPADAPAHGLAGSAAAHAAQAA